MRSSLFASLLQRIFPITLVGLVGFAVGRYTAPPADLPASSAETTSRSAATREHAAATTDALVPTRHGKSAVTAEERWKRWSTAVRTPEVERELIAALEELARTAPERAMQLAAQETSLRSRELLSQAVLRAWASTAPDAALAAAMKLPAADNRAAIAAVLQGAANNPETLLRLGRQITDGSDPIASDYGTLTIRALADAGHFPEALRFAMQGLPENRALWISEAFTAWARAEPQRALAELNRIAEPALQAEAQRGVVSGWAESDPGSLADYALRQPPTEDRTFALDHALRNWVLRDPGAASQWLSQRDADPDLDGGLATIANLPALVNQRPEVATEWAEAITDPQRRHAALRTIGDEWRRRSPNALQQFLQTNTTLTAADRAALAGAADPDT
jgi:hypothetical protein